MADAVIVGGGLAGLACAVALAENGLRPVVFERASQLGGRARSWTHAPSGDVVDIGPHVVHSEYANFLALLERLGTRDRIGWQRDRFMTLATQPPTVLRHRRLPPPLSLLPDLVAGARLGLRDLLSNNAPTWRALKFGEEDVPELDRIAALDYLRAAGVSERMIDWFWRFAAMVVMNVPLEQCSSAALLRVHAQLIGHRGLHFGFAALGLSELYAAQAERLIRAAGGDVLLQANARSLDRSGELHRVTLEDGRRIAARYCVCALPPPDLGAFCPGLAETTAFEPSPYISCYLWVRPQAYPRALLGADLVARAPQLRLLRSLQHPAGLGRAALGGGEQHHLQPPCRGHGRCGNRRRDATGNCRVRAGRGRREAHPLGRASHPDGYCLPEARHGAQAPRNRDWRAAAFPGRRLDAHRAALVDGKRRALRLSRRRGDPLGQRPSAQPGT